MFPSMFYILSSSILRDWYINAQNQDEKSGRNLKQQCRTEGELISNQEKSYAFNVVIAKSNCLDLIDDEILSKMIKDYVDSSFKEDFWQNLLVAVNSVNLGFTTWEMERMFHKTSNINEWL